MDRKHAEEYDRQENLTPAIFFSIEWFVSVGISLMFYLIQKLKSCKTLTRGKTGKQCSDNTRM